MYLTTIFINNKYSHKWVSNDNPLLSGTYLIIHDFFRKNGWNAICKQKEKEWHNAYTIDTTNLLSKVTIEFTCEEISHFNIAKFYQYQTEYYSDGNYRRLLNICYTSLSDVKLKNEPQLVTDRLSLVYNDLQNGTITIPKQG